ncbi:unnamed protein product [Rhizophagus irregularis]|nr:unnamed protein product [Rhizophagus irregularis]
MTNIREDAVWTAYNRAYSLTDATIHNTLDKRHEFRKQTILANESLTKDEKSEVIKLLNIDYDWVNIRNNKGTKRICENCQDECLATLYCEHCVRNYLKENFSNWTSGNNDIDNLIQICQKETLKPNNIVEWIPYNNLQNVKYLTKGGCSEFIQQFGNQNVILKELENVESANRRWFEEQVCRYSTMLWSNKNPSSGNYMLVINKMEMDLRTYLKQNYNNLTWKERIQMAHNIIYAIYRIHNEDAIHRDLHSGNILFEYTNNFRISDFGFCGPVDKSLNSVYGNLPYIAPEVITEKKYNICI